MVNRHPLRGLAVATGLSLLFTGYGCCGGISSGDLDGLEVMLEAVENASEEQRLSLAAAGFASVAEEGGWRVGTCADAWHAYGAASQETKQALVAEALDGCKAMCPAEKGAKAEVTTAIASMSAREKTQVVVDSCDEEGLEPVFTGDLEARRGQMELIEFWVFRSSFDETLRRLDTGGSERAKELHGRYAELAQTLGRGLVLGLPPLDPDLEVPDSTSSKNAPFAPSVQVSRSAIGVDGVEVVALGPDGRVPGHLRGKPIASLADALVPLAEGAVAEREAREARWEEETALEEPGSNPSAGEGAKAPQEEGKVGKENAKLKRAKGTKLTAAKETMDKQIVESAGMLADLNTMGAGGSLFGTGIAQSSVAAALVTPPPLTESARVDGRSLVVQCDRSLPYSQLYDTLYTAYQSGFGELRLGVWNEDRGRQTVVDASLGHWSPDWEGEPDEKPPLLLSILVTERGFHLRGNPAILASADTSAGWELGEPTIAAKNGEYAFEALTSLIVKVKAEYPDEEGVVIAADPGVSYDVVVQTADAVREHLPDGWERTEILFPNLFLTDPASALAVWKAHAERRASRDLGRRGSGTPGMSTGDPTILGAMDRSAIDRVIKRHRAQIRYCYQKELNKNPGLYGKIVIKFVIARDGSVSSVKTNTTSMNNPIVENCICQRFMRLKFPKPKGGGIVIVAYPFTFQSD